MAVWHGCNTWAIQNETAMLNYTSLFLPETGTNERDCFFLSLYFIFYYSVTFHLCNPGIFRRVSSLTHCIYINPWHEISNNVVCATSKASDQPAQTDQSLCLPLEYSMIVDLLTKHHLEILSFKGGYTGSSESTRVKMPHCWKSHVAAQLWNQELNGCLYSPYLWFRLHNRKKKFLISHLRHMLCVLKRTVSMRRFFWAPKTYAKIHS